jgi:Holliday junction resolvase RusA-like endonuclease
MTATSSTRRHFAAAIIAIAALAITGCRSSSTATGGTAAYGSTDGGKTADPAAAYSSLVASYADWSTLSVPVKIELTKPKRFSISGRAYMRRDIDVLISLKFLGMEVATIYIDNDSVHVTEKVHKYYVADGVSSLLAGYPLTVADLQSLLMGQAFVAGKGRATAATRQAFDLKADGSTALLTAVDPPDGIAYAFTVADSAVGSLSVSPDDYPTTTVSFSDTATSPAGPVASTVSVDAKAGSTPLTVAIKWSMASAEWNKDTQRRWKAPAGYTRLKRGDIINLLSSF